MLANRGDLIMLAGLFSPLVSLSTFLLSCLSTWKPFQPLVSVALNSIFFPNYLANLTLSLAPFLWQLWCCTLDRMGFIIGPQASHPGPVIYNFKASVFTLTDQGTVDFWFSALDIQLLKHGKEMALMFLLVMNSFGWTFVVVVFAICHMLRSCLTFGLMLWYWLCAKILLDHWSGCMFLVVCWDRIWPFVWYVYIYHVLKSCLNFGFLLWCLSLTLTVLLERLLLGKGYYDGLREISAYINIPEIPDSSLNFWFLTIQKK